MRPHRPHTAPRRLLSAHDEPHRVVTGEAAQRQSADDEPAEETDAYQGGRAADKCSGNPGLVEKEFGPACGTSYINYEFPRLSLPAFGESVIGSGTSTGIGGGGITRAVLRIPAGGLGVRVRDQIGYVDRNLPCSKAAKAKWKLATVHGMYLWLAYRGDLLPAAERDDYVRGKTANPPSPRCA